jgi:hypothetical protein
MGVEKGGVGRFRTGGKGKNPRLSHRINPIGKSDQKIPFPPPEKIEKSLKAWSCTPFYTIFSL